MRKRSPNAGQRYFPCYVVAVSLAVMSCSESSLKAEDGSALTSTSQTLAPVNDRMSVGAGDHHSLFVRTNGEVWASGQNTQGQLGTGASSTTPVPLPRKVRGLPAIRMAAAGAAHSLALDVNGRVWAWGANGSGQVGNGQVGAAVLAPIQVPLLSGIRAIAAGGHTSLALGTDGRVWAWGQNTEGQLGNGGTSAAVASPGLVAGLSVIRSVSAGRNHVLALGTDGRIWGWGQNTYGQVGTGNTSSPVVSPTLMASAPLAKAIAAGGGHSLLIADDGPDSRLWAWGRNDYGQVGNGVASAAPVLQPAWVSNNVFVVTDIAAGESFSLLIMADVGFVKAWGRNAEGQLGAGDTVDSPNPVNVLVGGNQLAYGKALFAGANHAFVLHDDCEPPSPFDPAKPPVWGWGDNTQGQLATGNTASAPTTAPVAGLLKIYHRDADGDGFGSDIEYLATSSCAQPADHLSDAGDCNDSNAAVRPGASDICDGLDNNCDGAVDDGQVSQTWYQDQDGDGYGNAATAMQSCQQPSGHVTVAGDCNDSNASIRPGASEVCDGADNNCNGAADEGVGSTWYRDQDGDGYGNPSNSRDRCSQPSGYVSDDRDCNDSNASIRPGAAEVCDGVDNNCNGAADENGSQVFYRDADGDGWGNGQRPTYACFQPAGYVVNASDCNDSDANTGQPRLWYKDFDNDGYDHAGQALYACSSPGGYRDSSNGADCHDGNSSIHPGAPEVCDGLDNDCDGQADEGTPQNWYYHDGDGDGFGNPVSRHPHQDCRPPPNHVTDNTDCNDSYANMYPGGIEVCDGLDNNCNWVADEGLPACF
ncbi:MopE-related protein [Pyxidicoccus trucidator]|uniref:RCC1 domain-containing protein n=1 Tax=Pyxidicoccus trucidator TaxID=2709662 RepID=UPI0013DD568B|nr:MopE-related protein [Pyxidicoccus trucidator]